MQEDYQFPEGFKSFIENNSLEMPPIPPSLISSLEEIEYNRFATDTRNLNITNAFLSIDMLKYVFPSNVGLLPFNVSEENFKETGQKIGQEEDYEPAYCAFGLSGYGFQNTSFYYFEENANIKIALRLPWARVYSDFQVEKANLKKAFMLIKIIQLAELENKKLVIVIDNALCEWKLYKEADESEEVFAQSNSFTELLELLDSDLIAEIKGFEHSNWMSV